MNTSTKLYMKNAFIAIIITAMPIVTFAEQALVPQSGQVLCYDASGTDILCTGTGQDGDQRMGVPSPNPRFIDNSNGTITDNLTGLTWLKNANCFGSNNWTNSLNYANALASGQCGLTDGSVAGDWRLPNIKELQSLLSYSQLDTSTWLVAQGFIGVQGRSGSVTDYYWSSSTVTGNTNYAWKMNLQTDMSSEDKSSFSAGGFKFWVMWPVRKGQ